MSEQTAPNPNPVNGEAGGAGSRINRLLLSALERVGAHRWLIVGLFQFGLLLGLVVVRFTSDRMRPTPHESDRYGANDFPEDAPSAKSSSASSFDLDKLAQADKLLRESRYGQAYTTYRSLYSDTARPMPDPLRFRVAMCLEGLARWDDAIAEFGIVAGNRNRSPLTAAAQLARARLWMRQGQTPEAKLALADIVLRSAQSESRNAKLQAEAILRLALITAYEAQLAELPGPMSNHVVAHASDDLAAFELEWAAKTASDTPTSDAERELTIEANGAAAHEILTSGTVARAPAWHVVQQLAYTAGRQCRSTPQAQQLLAGRTAVVAVDRQPLSVVLTTLTEPIGVLWELGDSEMHFCSGKEVSAEALQLYRFRLAEQALADALASYPQHALGAWARLELANLAYAQGEFEDAAVQYERLAASESRNPVAPEARYNLGVVRLRLDRRDEARQAFYLVVDGSPSHPLAALAYFNIGQSYLHEGAIDQAIMPLRRTTKLARDGAARRAAAAWLAAAHLLMGDAEEALAVLLEFRGELSEPPFRNVASFLTSYARFQTMRTRSQTLREGRVLSWSLVGASQESVLGPAGVLLMGHAYRDLGLGSEMVGLYQKAIADGVPPAFLAEMAYDTAEHEFVSGDRARAIERFAEIAMKCPGAQAQLSRIRLAEIALDDARLDQCLHWGRLALEKASAGERPNILKLLGHAYERMGSDQDAALCFAGQVPDSLAAQRSP